MAAMVFIFFGIFALVIVLNIGKGVSEWADNNRQPVLSEEVLLVTKRLEAGHSLHHHQGHSFQARGGHGPTSYYVTFEFASGIRREFAIDGEEYGMLAEGDAGTLTYQGTRYQGFVRHRVQAVVRLQD